MNEKAYKTMGITGAANIALGIVTLVMGITVGVISIISGVQLRKDRKGLTF